MSRLVETEAFVRVVEEGSFTEAAKRLGVTKSHVSKLVTRLEERLGALLLHRTTRRLTVTEAGRAYYERCADAITTVDQAQDEVRCLHRGLRGHLRITLPTGFGLLSLSEPLTAFKIRHPDLGVEAIFTDRHVDLLAEGFDLAVRGGDLPDSSLVARRILSFQRMVCASPAYLDRRGSPEEPEELVNHECLRYTYHNTPGTWRLRGPRDPVTVKVSGSFVANHGGMLVHADCRSLGLL